MVKHCPKPFINRFSSPAIRIRRFMIVIFPPQLSVAFICNTGSAQTILALRISLWLWDQNSAWVIILIIDMVENAHPFSWYSLEIASRGSSVTTRTTRTPVFWDTPAIPWLPILVIHIRFQVKTWQSEIYKFKKIAKNLSFEILQESLNTTHLLQLFDKMYKYEIDPTVGATERTQDAGRTDGRTDGVKPIYPTTSSLCEGV